MVVSMEGQGSGRASFWLSVVLFSALSFGSGLLVGFASYGNSQPPQTEVVESTDSGKVEVAVTVYDFLRERGVTEAGAAGVLGNFEWESGMDPAAVELGSGEGLGLAQWSGTRREVFLAAAEEQGVPWQDLDFQLDFLVRELAADFPAVWRELMVIQDPVKAAVLFHDEFEKSADSPERVLSNRGGSARDWLTFLSGRAAP